MAREGITAAQVAQAADALVGEGKQPTIRGVRDRLGGGSPNTVHRHLTAWRETRPPAVTAAPELPASLTASIAAEIERATAKARAEIEGYLVQAQTEAADLAQAGEVLEAEREALTEQVAALTRERDTLAGKAAQQAADLDAQTQRIEREQSAAESARVELATARLRIEGDAEHRAEQTQEIQRLRAALEAESKARVAGEQSAAVLAAKLEALRDQVEELREGRVRLEAERDQAREQAHQVQGEAREQARRIQEQVAALEALRGQVADAAAEGVKLNGALVHARHEAATAVRRAEGAEAQAQRTAEALEAAQAALVAAGAVRPEAVTPAEPAPALEPKKIAARRRIQDPQGAS
jgi:chromosome segregation ATPase